MMHIACTADRAYLPQCAGMLLALLEKHPAQTVGVHFLRAPDLARQDLLSLSGVVDRAGGEFFDHPMRDAQLRGLPRMAFIPALMWYRIYLPELLPAQDRVLYLDCDTLAVDSLIPLWQQDLDDHYVAAVDNVMPDGMEDWPLKLGMPPGCNYFNSGVLLFNLRAMRRDDMTRKLAEFGRSQVQRLRWPDQDALNYVLGGRRLKLHPRWNCQNSLLYWTSRSTAVFGEKVLREALSAPAILHFEGPAFAKPWHLLSQHPWRDAFRQAMSRSGFPVQLEGDDLVNRVIRRLPSRWWPALYSASEQVRTRIRGTFESNARGRSGS